MMSSRHMESQHRPRVWIRHHLDELFGALASDGFLVVGPRVRDGAIVYDALSSTDDLPCGWTDEQEAGHYRLRRRDDDSLFGYTVGPHAWKRFLLPPEQTLWRARRTGAGFEVEEPSSPAPRYAFIGVRGCEMAALRVHDRVFRHGQTVETTYQSRRDQALVVAVECVQAGGTCFCTSMGTGPAARDGFDIAMTELIEPGAHPRYIMRAGSHRGQEYLDRIGGLRATEDEQREARMRVQHAANSMGRTLDTHGVKELLASQRDNPKWSEIATRCLSCANCTLVCPTCFCSTVDDEVSLDGQEAARVRRWDSCFTADFTSLHGGAVRASTSSRYRQWLTHKLSTWHDQFGTSGCVGCGRCITWCPVGIDLTAEVAAIRASAEVKS